MDLWCEHVLSDMSHVYDVALLSERPVVHKNAGILSSGKCDAQLLLIAVGMSDMNYSVRYRREERFKGKPTDMFIMHSEEVQSN